ncbi:hypothetical protein JCM10207_008987 [Rhodosporidiobolus poonsookiae]
MRFLVAAAAALCAATTAAAAVLPIQADSSFLIARPSRLAVNATNSTYLPPSSDSFYEPPAGYQRKENGAVLRTRNISTAVDSLGTAYQVLYKTKNAQGQASSSVTTIFAPLQAVSPPQILLYMTPADTAAVDCQTSYALLTGTQSNVSSSSVLIEIVAALSKGWYVTVPDHEISRISAFISGRTEAQAGLDGLRALLNYRAALPSAEGYKAVIRGYSGGGHAAAWATTYLTSYGKGLNVVGVAAGGVPVDLYYTLDLLSGTNNTYLGFSALAGLANAEPELRRWLASNLYQNGTDALAYARSNQYCLDATANATYPWAGADLYTFVMGGETALRNGTLLKYFDENKLGTNNSENGNSGNLPIDIPIFMYHSKTDETVSYAPVRPYWLSQCAKGANVHLSTLSGSTHVNTYLAYLGDSFDFIERAFNGTVALDGCSSSDGLVNEVFSPGYVNAIGEAAAAQLFSLATATSSAGARF